jgi:hypothetical protein
MSDGDSGRAEPQMTPLDQPHRTKRITTNIDQINTSTSTN